MNQAIVIFRVVLFLALISIQAAHGETAATLKAREALRHERWDEALNTANRAISIDPGDAEAYSIRGKVYFKHEQFDKARADFDKALHFRPGLFDSALYQYRAQCYIEKQAFPQAVSDLQHAIRLYQSPTEYKLLGQVYCQQNRLEEALQCFSKAIALDKKSFWTYRDRGDVYARLKKYPSALSDYSKFIEMNPTAAVGYNTRAQIYLKMGKKDLAESDLKQARKFEKGFD